MISVPVTAAAGVAARSFHVTSPSKTLRPMVQMATGAACEAHQLQSSTTSVPAKGSTASNTSFDCQVSLFSATLHRIPCLRPARSVWRLPMTNLHFQRRKGVQARGRFLAARLIYNHLGSRNDSE